VSVTVSNKFHALGQAQMLEHESTNPNEVKAFRSPYEAVFSDCLKELGIRFRYEPITFLVGHRGITQLTYKPDFLLLDGKKTLLEPHPMYLRDNWHIFQNLEKFALFKEKYKDSFHLVLATDIDQVALKFRIDTSKPGFQVANCFDEYWYFPNLRQESGVSLPPTKEVVKSHLEDLMNRLRKH